MDLLPSISLQNYCTRTKDHLLYLFSPFDPSKPLIAGCIDNKLYVYWWRGWQHVFGKVRAWSENKRQFELGSDGWFKVYPSICQSCCREHVQATCSTAVSPAFWTTYSRGLESLQPEHHLTVRLSPYTIMNWPWKSICCLPRKQYHLFDLDWASVDKTCKKWMSRIC